MQGSIPTNADRGYAGDLAGTSTNLQLRHAAANRLDKMLVSILCYFYFGVTGTIGIVLVATLKLLTMHFNSEGRVIHKIIAPWTLHYMNLPPGWHLKVEGLSKVRQDTAYVIVANHQSSLDPFFLYSVPTIFKWTSKDWVFKVPVVGWVLNLTQNIRINPGHPSAFLKECRYWLKERKVSVIVFPEGTRSEDGELLRFKYGAFHLSAADDVPILPVVLAGSRDILPKGTWVLNYRANVTVSILDPIYPSHFDYNHETLCHLVRERMQAELTRLRGQ